MENDINNIMRRMASGKRRTTNDEDENMFFTYFYCNNDILNIFSSPSIRLVLSFSRSFCAHSTFR